MGLLKHPDGQRQLEVISNSVSIDYIVHHWLGMLHKLPYLLQMAFSYLSEEVNQIHVTFQLHFMTTKTFFFSIFSWEEKKKNRRNPEKREENLDQMVRPRLSSKQGFPVYLSPLMAALSFQRSRGVNTCSSVSSRSLRWGSACLVSPCVFVPVYRCVFAAARSGKGYSNKCGLSFDPAALKHTAPPTLVFSCIPTSVLWLKYHCFPHKHLL